MIHRRSGFTLIELMLAVAVAVIIMFLALPSIRGLSAEKKLEATFSRFDDLVKTAQKKAVAEQRAWMLVWDVGGIMVRPAEVTPEEAESGGAPGVETLPVSEEESYTIERPVALIPPKMLPSTWTFWRSGTCEPAIIRYTGPVGTWVAQYNPLTGHGEITDQQMR